MEKPDYVLAVFLRHFERTDLAGTPGFTCLEIGPGDSLASAMVARAYGAGRVWLIDAGDFADRDMAFYRTMATFMAAKGLLVPPESALTSIGTLLEWCNARYLTDGVKSFAEIPDGSIDLIWSQAVLEHIRRREFDALCSEMYRVLKPEGLASHRIDLMDHLGGSSNHLRFADRIWEADGFGARSGFYTNRLRPPELLAAFTKAGLSSEIVVRDFWPEPPLPRAKLARQFRDLPEEDLRTHGFDVVLQRT